MKTNGFGRPALLRRTRIRLRRENPWFELLEDRIALASDFHTLGGLTFFGDFEPDANAPDQLASDTFQTGVPALVGVQFNTGEFKSLLRIDGHVFLPDENSNSTEFQIGDPIDKASTISLDTVPTKPKIWSIEDDIATFDAQKLSGEVVGGLSLKDEGKLSGVTVAKIPTGLLTQNITLVNPDGPGTDPSDSFVHFGSVEIVGQIGVGYNPSGDVFSFFGGAQFKSEGLSGQNSSELEVLIGQQGDPGMVIADGSLEAVEVSFTGEFEAYGLEIRPSDLAFEYNLDPASEEYLDFIMYGGPTRHPDRGWLVVGQRFGDRLLRHHPWRFQDQEPRRRVYARRSGSRLRVRPGRGVSGRLGSRGRHLHDFPKGQQALHDP